MANSKDIYSILADAKKLLAEADDDNTNQDANAAPADDGSGVLDALGDLGVDAGKDKPADAPADDGTAPAAGDDSGVPDLGDDAGKAPDEGVDATTDDGTATVTGSKDDVQTIIDNALKSGKKVRIEIASESNNRMTARFISEAKGKSCNCCSPAEYKALVKKQKAGKEPLSKKEVKCIADYEKCMADAKKAKMKKVNESLIDALHIMDDRMKSMEAQMNGKQAISKIMEGNENMAQFVKPLDEAINTLDKVSKSVKGNSYVSSLSEGNFGLKQDFYKKVMGKYIPIVSKISEAATSAIKDTAFYTMIDEQAHIEEAANEVNKTKALLDSLLEDSAMSVDADGLDRKMVPNAVEAPTYVAQRANQMASANGVQMSGGNADGADVKKPEVYKLPVAKNAETGKLSLASAMSAIAEAFTKDGKFDAEGAAPAFLYRKSKKAKSIDDFKFPIAAIEEGKLVAVPSFIKTTAKMLASENSLSNIYKIPASVHAELRSKIMPYLQELGIECPWEQD